MLSWTLGGMVKSSLSSASLALEEDKFRPFVVAESVFELDDEADLQAPPLFVEAEARERGSEVEELPPDSWLGFGDVSDVDADVLAKSVT